MTPDRRAVLRLLGLRLLGPALAAYGWAARGRRAPGPPRLLVVRPDHLGDVLLASPVGQVLRSALPDAQIDWLVGPWGETIARRTAQADEVLTTPFPGFTRLPNASAYEPYALLLGEAARLRARSYDAALILRPDHWWGAMLAAAAGIPRRFGFGIPECVPFLTEVLPLHPGHTLESSQILARHAGRRLGGQDPACDEFLSPVFQIEPREAEWVTRKLGEHTLGAGPLLALHPGSGADLKNWPGHRWVAVLDTLQRRLEATVIITGAAGDDWATGPVISSLGRPPIDLVGGTSLGELAAVFARCNLVLGGDSGPLHLAAAVGTPTLRIYGPTSIREFGPWPPRGPHAALAANLPCQPCRTFVNPPCGARTDPPCLQAIAPETVVDAALGVLAPRKAAPPTAAPC